MLHITGYLKKRAKLIISKGFCNAFYHEVNPGRSLNGLCCISFFNSHSCFGVQLREQIGFILTSDMQYYQPAKLVQPFQLRGPMVDLRNLPKTQIYLVLPLLFSRSPNSRLECASLSFIFKCLCYNISQHLRVLEQWLCKYAHTKR